MSTRRTTAVGPGDPWYETGPVNVTPVHPADSTTIVDCDAELSEGVSSISDDVTLAVLVTSPGVGAVAAIVIVAEVPAARLPKRQTACPARTEHVPCDRSGVANVRPAGTGSTTTTFVAVVVPVFVTVTV